LTNKRSNPVGAAPRPLTSVEQRWFVGAHANIGGGYQSDLLAQKPLRWMMSKASLLGLTFRSDVVLEGDTAHSPIADSYRDFMYGAYRFVSRPYYRPLGEAPKETADSIENNVNETIDASVFERWREDANYRPKNLANWTQVYNADPSKLNTSVMAHDPNTAAPD
jgi:Uncharacterized alpha/beta hydrolase domain (DUF2235)